MYTVMNFVVLQKEDTFLTSRVIITFQIRNRIHEAGWLVGQLVDCRLIYVIFIQALHVFYTFWIWLCLTAAAIRHRAHSSLSEAG
jgi:hypothetical protein